MSELFKEALTSRVWERPQELDPKREFQDKATAIFAALNRITFEGKGELVEDTTGIGLYWNQSEKENKGERHRFTAIRIPFDRKFRGPVFFLYLDGEELGHGDLRDLTWSLQLENLIIENAHKLSPML